MRACNSVANRAGFAANSVHLRLIRLADTMASGNAVNRIPFFQEDAKRMSGGGRLFRKYVRWTMTLVCGALLVTGAIGVYFSYQENKSALSIVQREKAVAAAARIEQLIREIERQLAFVAQPQLGAGGTDELRIEFLKFIRQVPAVTVVAQIDRSGREQLM